MGLKQEDYFIPKKDAINTGMDLGLMNKKQITGRKRLKGEKSFRNKVKAENSLKRSVIDFQFYTVLALGVQGKRTTRREMAENVKI